MRFRRLPVVLAFFLGLTSLCGPGGVVSAQQGGGANSTQASDMESFFSAPVRGAATDSVARFQENATTEELLESAREMFIQDNYPLSEMLYKSVLVREPDNLSAMLELAIVYETTGKLEYARGLLTRASLLNPYDETIIERQNAIAKKLSNTLEIEVDSLLAAGQHEQALPKLSLLLTTQPENAELHYKKAQCHLALERPDAAMEEINKALNLRSDNRYYKLRDRITATAQGRNLDALVIEAQTLLENGSAKDREKGLQLVMRILDADPDNEWAAEQFRLLTDDPAEGVAPSGAKPWLRSGLRAVGGFFEHSVGLFEILNRHLRILVTVLIVLVVFMSPLTHTMLRGFAPRHFLSGRLDRFSIHEILTLINTHHLSGLLKVKSTDASGRIYFNKGEIDHCTSGDKQGRKALQSLLDNARDGHFVFRDARLPATKTVDTPLSLILMDLPERRPDQDLRKPARKKPSKMRSLLQNKS